VLEFLFGLYPEAVSEVTSEGKNLLHLAIDYNDDAVSKVQFLCSRCPAMLQQRDNTGSLPIHFVTPSLRFKISKALYEAGGIEQFKTPIAHPTNATYVQNGRLPLHLFIRHQSDRLRAVSSAISEAADMFRWLLRLYPEAAGIEGGAGARHTKTPYQLAVDRNLPDYFLRLLLRAAPTLHPAELRRLNYAERRMAMFLAFKATSGTLQAPLLVRLRGESKDLVQRVVSFL
jgi:hypothetical protein